MASHRAFAIALAAAALPLAAPALESAAPRPMESDLTVALQPVLGVGWFHDRGGSRSGVAPEVDLLFLRRGIAAGPFLAAGGGEGQGAQDGVWLGLAGGWSLRLKEWMRLDLLAEGGAHEVIVASEFAGEAAGTATLPFVGARAGLRVTGEVFPTFALLWARRGGLGLQATARADLGHDTVQPGSPPGFPAAAAVRVGGQSLTVGLTMALEW